MDRLYIEPTAQTPLVDFNGQTGDMTIKGRSIPDSPDEFWNKVLNWFERYVVEPTSKTTFNIDLEYFNVSSSKRILSLLYKLNRLAENGFNVEVNWYYREDDEDMFEVGQDYAYMVKVPFNFKDYQEPELALAM